jgi:hypothetical protein
MSRRIVLAHLIRPRRIGDNDAVRPTPGQLRRLAPDRLGLAHIPQPLVRTINPSCTVHVLDKPAILVRLRLRGCTYHRDLLHRAARDPSEGANLVACLTWQGSETFATLCPFTHASSRRGLLDRLQPAPDGIDLGRREVLTLGVFGKLAARDLVEVDDGVRDLVPAEPLECLDPPLAGDQRAVR